MKFFHQVLFTSVLFISSQQSQQSSYRGGGIIDCRYTDCEPYWLRESCNETKPCSDNSCCSYRGFCGNTEHFCSHGCQSNCWSLDKNITNETTTTTPVIQTQTPLPRPTCGQMMVKGRVPWQVRLRIEKPKGPITNETQMIQEPSVFLCSGVIIGERAILTSAKCVIG